MAQTFDTSRVGGGTYELEQDASGNYKLKSVGFAQINKLNLPDLATSDTTTKTDTTKTEEKKTQVADPFKKLSLQNQGSGGGQDYSGVMLKTPEVKEATVRSAGDRQRLDPRDDRSPQEIQNLKNAQQDYNTLQSSIKSSDGASKGVYDLRDKANETIMSAREKYATETQYNRPERVTGLQKVKSKATDTIGNVIDSVKNNKAIQVASKVLGFVMNPIMGVAKMVIGALPEETAVQKVNKGYFNINEGGQRISGNPATDLYAGMNRNSAYGNLEKAGNKRIDTREKTAVKKGYTKDNDPTGFVAKTEKMKNDARSYKQAKETATDTSPGATGGEGGGSGGSDSGRVICTDLHRTGELSTRDWIRDTKFTFKTLSIKHVKGYLLWAEPTVKHMQKYPKYRKIWKHIAQHRANDIAWRLNEGKFDLLGRIYAGIGEPVCWALGNFVSNKQISKYNLTHWRRA